MTTLARLFLSVIVVTLGAGPVSAQFNCLTPDQVKALVARVNSTQNPIPDQKLKDDLLKLSSKTEKLISDSVEQGRASDGSRKRISETTEQNNVRLCRILKESGWPRAAAVGAEGVAAALFLLRNARQPQMQVELFPLVEAAVGKGEVEKAELALLVDRIRVDSGNRQLFGTHVKLIDGFLVLVPIEAEAQVDVRRKQFGLMPLAEQFRSLERDYRRPLIRSVAPTQPANQSKSLIPKTIAAELETKPEEEDVVRVNTNLVSLNVSVFSNKLQSLVGSLTQNDFRVVEDGNEEAVTYFASSDIPFDLVLLIDLSGSTVDKRALINQTTQRFIEAARPTDRIAIVTFSNTTEIVCALTSDRARLVQSVSRIQGSGGTHFWDALKFTLEKVVGLRTLERRRAIVVMSDGVDNALAFRSVAFQSGSQVSFADLLEAVRKTDELIIPIYLDTENDGFQKSDFTKRVFENARNTLALLAKESGGFYYRARKIEDLNGVYDQVIRDLGKVYSVGYRPTNEKRDGSWRRVEIRIPNRVDLTVRSRPGYYAN
jgi:VWFA-related protein